MDDNKNAKAARERPRGLFRSILVAFLLSAFCSGVLYVYLAPAEELAADSLPLEPPPEHPLLPPRPSSRKATVDRHAMFRPVPGIPRPHRLAATPDPAQQPKAPLSQLQPEAPQQHQPPPQQQQQQQQPASPAAPPTSTGPTAAPPLLSPAVPFPSRAPPLPAVTPASATVEELGRTLGIVKASKRTWNVIAGTTWFGGSHPWARGPVQCPGGCSINWQHGGFGEADVLLIHGDQVGRAPQKPAHSKQIVALWASETFDLPERGAKDYSMFHTEFTTRLGGFMRDPYFADLVDQARPDALPSIKSARCWDDVFEHIVPAAERVPLSKGSITFASTHCRSRSGRERVIKELSEHVPVKVYGSTCQRNVNEEENKMGRLEQWALWRTFKFYLALENHICEGYLTEKALKSLIRGQVPIYLGAPEAAELLPPGSFIDASRFKTGAELAAYLQFLDANDDEYMKYHAWRYASFETYPLQFRREIISLINLLASYGPGHHSEYMSCLMCYSLQDWAERHNWDPPTDDAFKQGIKPWECFPAWPEYVPPAFVKPE